MRTTLGIVAAAFLASGCVTMKKYKELEAQYTELSTRHSELTDQHAKLMSKADGLRLEVDDLEEYVDLLKQSNEHLGSFYTDLITDFRPQLESEDVEIIVYPDRMSLALSHDVTFSTGSARVTRAGSDTMGKLAELVERHPERRFVVEGHTDSRPISTARYRNNWELGAARAVAVVESLIEQGIPADRLAVVSYGDTEPLAPNDTPDNQRINRRVEVSFQPTLEELPGHRVLVDAAQSVTLAHGATEAVVPEMDQDVPTVPDA